MTASLAPSSQKIYSKAWSIFHDFAVSQGFQPDSSQVSASHIALFIAYLFGRKCAPKTISTYLSAVSYVHKLKHNSDPTDSFLVKKLVAGSYRLCPSVDMRLPITVQVLNKLLSSLVHTAKNPFELVLFRAMFLFAFSAFARVGEIATSGSTANLVQFQDVSILRSKNNNPVVHVHFSNFKHNVRMQRHSISFGHGPSSFSAVVSLENYLKYRGCHMGPLFLMLDNAPVARNYFDKVLHSCLQFCGLDSTLYKGHSFRIGAASLAAEQGHSDAHIRACGRWHSNAFRKYIRPSTT